MFSVPIQNEELPIDILLTGLASTNDYPVYQVPDPDIIYLPIPKPIGDNQDEGGCCISCGYSYCPSLDDCVRPWETYCQELDFPYNALYKGGGIVLPQKKSNDE